MICNGWWPRQGQVGQEPCEMKITLPLLRKPSQHISPPNLEKVGVDNSPIRDVAGKMVTFITQPAGATNSLSWRCKKQAPGAWGPGSGSRWAGTQCGAWLTFRQGQRGPMVGSKIMGPTGGMEEVPSFGSRKDTGSFLLLRCLMAAYVACSRWI